MNSPADPSTAQSPSPCTAAPAPSSSSSSTSLFTTSDSSTLSPSSYPRDHPRVLIPELCRLFYTLGWVTGTGGGVAMVHDGCYFLAPSGVQKERIEAEDLFVLREPTQAELDDARAAASTSSSSPSTFPPPHLSLPLLPGRPIVTLATPPPSKRFNASQCTPLFFSAFDARSARCCIHSHAISAVLVTLLYAHEFSVSEQEMIKGIEGHQYYSRLTIPIIDNTAHEKDLTQSLQAAISAYPHTVAVLVRRHGVYVWGRSWQQAKTQAECLHYLFDYAVQLHQLGLKHTVDPHTDAQNGHAACEH